MAVLQRRTVEPRGDYHAYREDLRRDFWYSCAYCTITELEARGIGFEIEHYLPQAHFAELRNDYSNLLWSCEKCNDNKGDYFIPPGTEHENTIIRPDRDDPDLHYAVDGHQLVGKTPTGRFNVGHLRLNRTAMVRVRGIRARTHKATTYIANGVRAFLERPFDNLPMQDRVKLLRENAGIERDYEELCLVVESFIEALSRSVHIDPDPRTPQETAARRGYLRDQRALTAEYRLPRVKVTRRTRRKRKRKSDR